MVAQAKPPRSGVLQLFRCATCQIQQAPCSGAPVRTAKDAWGSEHQLGNRRGSSAGYGTMRSPRFLTKYPSAICVPRGSRPLRRQHARSDVLTGDRHPD